MHITAWEQDVVKVSACKEETSLKPCVNVGGGDCYIVKLANQTCTGDRKGSKQEITPAGEFSFAGCQAACTLKGS